MMTSLRDIALFGLFVGAFFFMQWTDACAAPLGYAYEGICYSDMAAASVAFTNHYPNQQGWLMYDLATVNVGVPAANAITYQLAMTNLTSGGTQLLPAVSMTLHSCESTLTQNGGLDRVLIIMASVFSFFFGFSVGRSFSQRHVFAS